MVKAKNYSDIQVDAAKRKASVAKSGVYVATATKKKTDKVADTCALSHVRDTLTETYHRLTEAIRSLGVVEDGGNPQQGIRWWCRHYPPAATT